MWVGYGNFDVLSWLPFSLINFPAHPPLCDFRQTSKSPRREFPPKVEQQKTESVTGQLFGSRHSQTLVDTAPDNINNNIIL